jgi:hypothetical protein
MSPEAVTTILAPISLGVEPKVDTIVATASVSPDSNRRFI